MKCFKWLQGVKLINVKKDIKDDNLLPMWITVHCSDSVNENVDAEEIKRWHVEDNGWDDIGYHYVIDLEGNCDSYTTGIGRALNVPGAHVYGHNWKYDKDGKKGVNVGICLIGRDKYTRKQFYKLYDLVQSLWMTFDIHPYNFACHNTLDRKKSCPNMTVQALLLYLYSGKTEFINQYMKED